MNILIIGGTRLLGRALVETALSQNHSVTLFNRRQSAPDVFADLSNVEQIHGDRHADLHLLDLQNGGRAWDAAIDTCGYISAAVRAAAEALADKVEHYTFISSMSVYADQGTPDADETAKVAKLEEGQGGGQRLRDLRREQGAGRAGGGGGAARSRAQRACRAARRTARLHGALSVLGAPHQRGGRSTGAGRSRSVGAVD